MQSGHKFDADLPQRCKFESVGSCPSNALYAKLNRKPGSLLVASTQSLINFTGRASINVLIDLPWQLGLRKCSNASVCWFETQFLSAAL